MTPLLDETAMQAEVDQVLEDIINPPNLILEISS
jgi:hypothetical protein